MGRLANLNPSEVDVIYGPVKLEGWAEDEFVNIDRDDDLFLTVQGVDGELARSFNAKDLTKVEATLLQTSKSNNLLSGLMILDSATGGRSVQSLLIKDRSGSTLFAAPFAWISKPPAQPFGGSAKERKWTFMCTGMPPTNIIGGN